MYFDLWNICVSEIRYVSCLRAAMGRLKPDELPEVVTWGPRQRRPIAGQARPAADGASRRGGSQAFDRPERSECGGS
jgi:hypothetical protein